jgi:DNA ligase (NAD+)
MSIQNTQAFIEEVIENPHLISKLKEEELVLILNEAQEAYHSTGTPIMTDDLYDVFKQRLQKLNPKHPFLKQVGAPVKGEKVKLPYYMGSLDKIRDDPKHVENFKKKYPGNYVVSDKLDGISALIVYEHKKATMYTRGDGIYGQDISRLASLMKSLPKAISIANPLVVRGEIILSRASWNELKHKGANARNVVAGAVNAKEPDAEVLRHLQFVAYEVLSPKEIPSNAFTHLKNLGFKTPHYVLMSEVEMNNETLSQLLIQRRANSEFECDGIVIRHDKEHKYIAGKNPKYAFAYKSILTHEEAEVIIHTVEWNVSKDGFLKPTLLFDTVVLAGVKIQRATGFNGQFIEKNKIGPGSRVVIIRSGDVIPHVVRVLSPSATGKPNMPTIPFEWTDTHVDIYVVGEDTDDMKLKQMEFFVNQLDIKYLAKGTLAKLFSAGFNTISKVMHIKEADLLKIDGIQSKGAHKIYESIQKTKQSATCLDYLNASNKLGRGIGRKKIESLVQAYPEILEGRVPNTSHLVKIEGLSSATIQSMIEALPATMEWIKEIDATVCTKKKSKSPSPSKDSSPSNKHLKELEGKTIVFTGFRNKEWEDLLKQVQCKVSNSVTKSLYLVVALDPSENSSKLQKAKDYQLTILSKTEFQSKYRLP